ncbi:DeoR/GlpR family DNA-binding transcription regulator [Halobacillus salinarum]|uniref:DeoR/GlpR family DNA-binding transcription regulator n=1 Tax=Halobacillus salinarum TaxID=2932257 RepID=A0ABY4ELF0_9BACI|nr:DeoR/GlpR family DNA-binding transcription regulator [Halobacillus salinarum]UOQ44989.1 DeoR/GlpR family DNA-binding transcription regulator [Halobacillus salinarum]
MLVAERQRKIVDLVNEKLSIRVTELSRHFSVTEETIRRDLEKLEKQNLLRRSHGGAVSVQEEQSETSYLEREITNAHEKRAIALEAVKQIIPGEKIILDASTTAWYMAKELPDLPLTVITNSVKVAVELSKKEKVNVISTGGMLLPKSLSFVGPLAENSLTTYHVDKAFISCKGVHLRGGLTDSNEWQALIKRQMMNIADETVLMVDSSKFDIRTFVQIGRLADVSSVLTDDHVRADYVNAFEELNIPIKTVTLMN